MQKDSVKTYPTPSVQQNNISLTGLNHFQKKCVWKRQPEGRFLPVTGEDGQRVYLKVTSSLNHQGHQRALSSQSPAKHLIPVSVEQLKYNIDREKQLKLLEDVKLLTASVKRAADPERDESTDNQKEGFSKGTKQELWVEEYTPRHYSELLSDDGTNRTVLHWLKLWDKVVFGKEVKVRPQNARPDNNPKGKQQQQQQHHKRGLPEVNEELDEHSRPHHKVALLCGPPGLGKTTLAHVIARHAGYNVVEMNASDDRSAEVFQQRIESATQMKSMLTPDQRPNCLVIDEIDGAPNAAINILLSVIKKKEAAGEGTGEKKRKKKKDVVLKRPIICICNDLYVPSLRQLKQNAFVVQFPLTLSTRLSSRLFCIAKENGLKCDMTTLMALCNKAENDIRSCVNTLQFVHSHSRELTLATVNSISIGQKDQHKGLFAVWQQVFQLPKAERKAYTNPHDVHAGSNRLEDVSENSGGSGSVLATRFNKMLQTIQANGDYDKTMQGIFENYLEMKFKDPYFDAVNKANEWLEFYDIINKEILHSQNYSLSKYLAYLPVTFHMLFASGAYPKIHYPSSQFECLTKRNKTTNLVASMLADVGTSVKRNVNLSTAVLELLPPLMEILQPAFRPVNTHLFSQREKEQLSNLVHTMITYNLTYRQLRSADGQYQFCLEPNMEEVVFFAGSRQRKAMAYMAKQLIAREIELEKMRKSEKLLTSNSREKEPGTPKPSKAVNDQQDTLPRHKEKLKPKEITIRDDQLEKDFFGRIVKSTNHSNSSEPSNNDNKKTSTSSNMNLWYKFNEGYTNAIRRTVKIQDLL